MSTNGDKMIETLSSMIKGHVTIKDADTGEILVDKDNAVHFGNISTEIAQALVGDNESFITYMVFGNGGVIIDESGNIIYRKPNTSLVKEPTAQLYSSTLVTELTNSNNEETVPGAETLASVPGGNTKNFEDIVVSVTLPAGYPDTQAVADNASNSNNQSLEEGSSYFVFNELSLYTGVSGLGDAFNDANVQNFLSDTTTRLITHVIFHPVQKSQNRTLAITYTLRIQMGE